MNRPSETGARCIGSRDSEQSDTVNPRPPEDQTTFAGYRVAPGVTLITFVFAGALWGGAAVDVLVQPVLSFVAIAITALIIMRSAKQHPSIPSAPLCMLLMLGSNVLATQYVARALLYAPTLGDSWRVAGVSLYSPLAWSSWVQELGPEAAPLTFAIGMTLAYGGLVLGLLLGVYAAAVRLDRQRPAPVVQ